MKLETESDEEGIIDLPENIYHSRRALRIAIKEWIPEFKRQKQAHGPIVKPQPAVAIMSPVSIPLASFNTCMATSTTTITTTSTSSTPLALCTTNNVESISSTTVNGNSNVLPPAVASTLNPPLVIMNSLVSESKVISEPMDCNISPALSPQSSDMAMNTDNGSVCKLYTYLNNLHLFIIILFLKISVFQCKWKRLALVWIWLLMLYKIKNIHMKSNNLLLSIVIV